MPSRRSAIVSLALSTVAAAEHYAVLAAGSQSYDNYRHQADVCHAYQVLKENGFKEENIITMMYDDVAHSSSNPFPGQLFNKPSSGAGKDVYAGCKIDYRGYDVSASTFKNVLTGEGSGKVLKSTSEDNVFVFFADHGATGLICFPGGNLHKADLKSALKTMHSKNMYKKLVFYLESCESGSMFEGYSVPGVYSVSAASPSESSYGAYCGSSARVNGRSIGSCLGDLFSIKWMEDSDAEDITAESLAHQYSVVERETSASHVMQWSDTSFTNDMVSLYQGAGGPSPTPTPSPSPMPIPTPTPSPTPTPTPSGVQLIHEGRSCQVQTVNLGSLSTPESCAEAAKADSQCQGYFMHSAQFWDNWGCRCCVDDQPGKYNDNWSVYSYSPAATKAVSVREIELQQPFDNYRLALTSEERLAAGAKMQAVLKDQLAAVTAYEKFLDIVYPGDDASKSLIREVRLPADNRDCEMAARESFTTYGEFDAYSGFSLQFHRYVVNVCADVAASGSTVNVADAAKQACIGEPFAV